MTKKILLIVSLLLITFLLAVRFMPKEKILSGYSFSQAVFDRNDKLLRLTTSEDEQFRLFIPLSKMPESLKTGTILYEDKYFYLHRGFNPAALIKGFWTSIIKKSRPVGASTITMQLARIIYGIDSSSISGKIKQIIAAVWIEMRYGKNDILEAYLNIAPYGYNIEGAGAASVIYFSKKAETLSILESFSLCVIPQNPNFRRLSDEERKEKTEKARKRVFQKWIKKHPKDADKSGYFDMPLHIKKPADLPFEAPHFVNRIIAENKDSVINTTLDLHLQKNIEERIKYYVARNESRGINNVCAMLINYKTMEVEAYVGSADFFDDAIQGQVNGCAAYRSPGSTLKPFIYAIALEKGLIHPMTLLKDTPKHYGVYAPENSDRDFMGPVFATQALTQSRNIPAIDLLIKTNPDSLINMLKKAEVKNLKDSAYYGSSLAIGGFEISMEKIVQIYAMLANLGVLKDLRFLKFSQTGETTVLSPEAAFLTLEMLKDNKDPQGEIKAALGFKEFEVYWKTGTSYAFRDAWSAGVFGDYVLAVWSGKFNNEGQQSFMARTSAAPLFFELIKSVRSEKKDIAKQIDDDELNIAKIDVCSISGDLPSQYCKNTMKSYFIPGKSPITICDVHRPVYIDQKTGLRLPYYIPEKTNIAVFEFWDSEILEIFKMAGVTHRIPPRYMPDIEIGQITVYGNPPRINLPTQNIIYTLRVEDFENETIPFRADTDSDAKIIYWFLDNRYIGQSRPGTVLLAKAEAGLYTVKAIDDLGRASQIRLRVEIIGK
ncbi:MAG: penicillin-binding protein 1C [Endomicrobia bacterium]|nr:penicillin-binding protein 1C [Endomicrobiia bacterium]MCL2507151.1 penicillin-binding protein 1C [Endomicrobiia bacterium]